MAVAFEEHDGSRVATMVDSLWASSRCKKTSRTAEKSQQPFSNYTLSKISAETSAREAIAATPASKSTVLPIVPTKQADNSNCELCSENQTEKENKTMPTLRSLSCPPKNVVSTSRILWISNWLSSESFTRVMWVLVIWPGSTTYLIPLLILGRVNLDGRIRKFLSIRRVCTSERAVDINCLTRKKLMKN